MLHVLLRVEHIVSCQLKRFRIDYANVVAFTQFLHQVLVNKLAEGAPFVPYIVIEFPI